MRATLIMLFLLVAPGSADAGRRGTTPEPAGTDPGEVAREIHNHMGAVRACYELFLRRNPAVTGRLQLRFVVDAAGRVLTTVLEQDTMQAGNELFSCIQRSAQRWRLPPSSAGFRFSFPFLFQASN